MKNLRTTFNTRQYMLSKDFEIYYYSDTHMKGVEAHSHNYYEFYFFLSGSLSLVINGIEHTPTRGDMILIPPNVSHYSIIKDSEISYQRFVFWISQEYCNQLLELSNDFGYLMQHVIVTGKYSYHFDIFTFNSIQSKIFALIEELNSKRFGRSAKISLCVSDLILSLNRSVYEIENPQTPKEQHSLYQNLLAYIEDHLDEELTLELLAKEFFVSKYHISHVFKENLGISLHQYVLKKRLAVSREAIISHSEISEAYMLSGFKDYSNFFRAFKKEYGISPKEFKELYTQSMPEKA